MMTILPVIVLYKKRLHESSTYCTLARQLPDPHVKNVIVYDNSPVAQQLPEGTPVAIEYHHDCTNSGLATAYNLALNIAFQRKIPWLLLLDHDSALPRNFLMELGVLVRCYSSDPSVVAVVPQVWDGHRMISPKRVALGRLRPIPEPGIGICDYEVTAINSAAAIRTSFLTEIGGFNANYWLDFLDFWLFSVIHANRRKVAISPSRTEHQLSVSNYRRNISLDRYRSIIHAEAHFMTSEKGKADRFLYPLRLLARAVKQLIIARKPRMAFLTLRTSVAIICHLKLQLS
jgi:hypothetical protein